MPFSEKDLLKNHPDDVFAYLKENKIDDINATYSHASETLLHYAAFHQHIELTEAILELGGLPDIQDAFGDTALHIAADKGHWGIINLLLTKGRADYHKKNDLEEKPGDCIKTKELKRSYESLIKTIEQNRKGNDSNSSFRLFRPLLNLFGVSHDDSVVVQKPKQN